MGGLFVLAIAVVVATVIWFAVLRHYSGQKVEIQFDAIRTAGTLVIGTGGAVALLLTARRQRYIEMTLLYTDRDATERRITELYTKAADQLGSEKAPVRLAGLYALERLAHSTVEHRQTMVDVICAYLRMPYTPPQTLASVLGRPSRSLRPARRRRAQRLIDQPAHATPTSQGARQEHARQEEQVRLTAQNILLRNLRVTAQRHQRWWHRTPPPEAPAWPGIRLDLTGALLLKFFLPECQLDYANFSGAQFTGRAIFSGTQFTSGADFWGAQFIDGAEFRDAKFPYGAYFGGAQFIGGADFWGAQFSHWTYFVGAQFTSVVRFERAQFTDRADFEGTRVTLAAEPESVWPPGWTTRSAKPDNREDPAFLYLTKVEESPDA
ncbi:MAG: pentapeptide repeat-containing protein [Pseudonocardiaceae bacterium]